MSGELRSPVEEALENQPFGALQLRVVLLCALVQAFDGFDLGTIGMAAPSLSKAWGVAPPLFTTAFVMSSVGILVGALLSGPLGDRFGRKPLIVISVGFIGLFSVMSAFAWSIPSITVMRFLTGLGIGGAMPATVALTSDYSPIQRRGTLIYADVLRQYGRRLSRWAIGRADPADLRLAKHLFCRRHPAAGADPVPDAVPAGDRRAS